MAKGPNISLQRTSPCGLAAELESLGARVSTIAGLLVVCAQFATAVSLGAQTGESTSAQITKIRVHCDAPDLPKDHFLRKDKTIWLSGKTRARIEEQKNPATGRKLLIVIDEPQTWQVDLVSRSGTASRDPGPRFEVRLPLFPDVPELAELEFGHEYEFFQHQGNDKRLPETVLRGKKAFGYALEGNGFQVLAYFLSASHAPEQIGVGTRDRVLVFVYDSYEHPAELPAALFAPPEGIKWNP